MSMTHLYQIDIAFDPDKGYGAVVGDLIGQRQKGIRGNSIRQLCRRIHEAVCQDEQQKRYFPLEHEKSRIITPNGFNSDD